MPSLVHINAAAAIAGVLTLECDAQMMFSPKMEALQNLPCNEKLPRILLKEGDFEDCAAEYGSADEAMSNCQKELKALLSKTGEAVKNEQCHHDLIHFMQEKIMNVDAEPIVAAIAELEDCANDPAYTYEACTEQLWVSIQEAYPEIEKNLVKGLEEKQQDTLTKFGDTSREFYKCLATADPLQAALNDDAVWKSMQSQLQSVLDEFESNVDSVADLLTPDMQSVLKVFYQISAGETKGDDTADSSDWAAVPVSKVIPRIALEGVVDARACKKQWTSFKKKLMAVANNEDMVTSLHTVMDHMYFLGNAKKWLLEAMKADKLKKLLKELDCAFDWKDSSQVSECTQKVADALRDFHARVEGSDVVSKVKSELESKNKLHATGDSDDSDDILVVLVGGFMVASVFAAVTYGAVHMYGKHRKGGRLFNSDRIDESMMMVSDEDDHDSSDDELAL